jgi:hypothetical protein
MGLRMNYQHMPSNFQEDKGMDLNPEGLLAVNFLQWGSSHHLKGDVYMEEKEIRLKSSEVTISSHSKKLSSPNPLD